MRILFLFRRINDFDQLFPIMHFLKKKDFRIQIESICSNPNLDLSVLNNYKIDKKIVTLSSVNELFNYYKLLSFVINTLSFLKLRKLSLMIKDKFIKNLSNKINSKWNKKIKDFKPNLLVLDYPSKLNFGLDHLLKISKKNKIKVLGIHHGVWLRMINHKNQTDERTLKQIQMQSYKRKFSIYDWIIVSNRYHRRLIYTYNKNVMKEKTIVCLGSLRFNSLWTKNYTQLSNIHKPKNRINKLNILYIDHSCMHGLFGKKIFDGLSKINDLKYVKLTIQPNVSNIYNKSDYNNYENYNLSSNKLKELKGLFSNESTIDLIKKSDIVINTISSAAIEAILQKKIILYPKHWHTNLTYYEKFKSCNLFTNDEDMIKFINNLFKYKNFKISNYYSENYKKFLKFTVNNNLSEKECIENYCEFILSKI